MSRYGPRIAALARRAERERRALESAERAESDAATPAAPASPNETGVVVTPPKAPEAYLREGAGQAIWCYVEARTGGRMVPLSDAELTALWNAMNRWLECYTRCYGVELEAAFTIREAAELLLQTRNIDDVGQLLTGVPDRGHERER